MSSSSLPAERRAQIAATIFPDPLPTVAELLARFPARPLAAEAMVTRFAPSPTGFMHLGGVYMALISQRFAQQSGGAYFLRLEDTDQKRRVEGAEAVILHALEYFSLQPDEGPLESGADQGAYGPYRQSQRGPLYDVFLKHLVAEGQVYPCFCTEEEMAAMKAEQERLEVTPGYYGTWAKWRDADADAVEAQLAAGRSYVLRFRSTGDRTRTRVFKDLIKGPLTLPENDLDVVVMKLDRLPTYHFAHAVDDSLMRTTHVLRADEWVSSLPVHYQLFTALGFPQPKFGHVAPINKIDESGARRKLSKRKDPEANVEYYQQKGYPRAAVIEYLMNLANSDFEPWRKANPLASHTELALTFRKLSNSTGPLFDEVKLADIAKNLIARLTTDEAYSGLATWARRYVPAFAEQLAADETHWKAILAIDRGETQRKDLSCWSMVEEYYRYFARDFQNPAQIGAIASVLGTDELGALCAKLAEVLPAVQSRDHFMEVIRGVGAQFGFAPNIKEFKASPERFRGHIGEITQVLRLAVTGLEKTPDLHSIITVLGLPETQRRLAAFAQAA